MPNAVKWSALGTSTTAMSTELNSLANGSRAIASSAVDNDAARNMYADFELYVTYGVAPSAGGRVDLYLVQTLDGTNYADGSASVAPPMTSFAGSFPLRAVTTAQRIVLRHVLLPATDYKPLLDNQAGQAMAASGNTLKYRAYNAEVQ